jgi:hypothetical protein
VGLLSYKQLLQQGILHAENLFLQWVDDIAAIAELVRHEDAIMMARDKIACLDDMSLEEDIPDNVLDIGEVREKALLTGN